VRFTLASSRCLYKNSDAIEGTPTSKQSAIIVIKEEIACAGFENEIYNNS